MLAFRIGYAEDVSVVHGQLADVLQFESASKGGANTFPRSWEATAVILP